MPEFVIENNPTPEQVQYLEDRIYDYNSGVTGLTDGEMLAIFVRDESISRERWNVKRVSSRPFFGRRY